MTSMAVARDTIHKVWRCADGTAVKDHGETDWVVLWEPSLALTPRWDLCRSIKYKTQATQTTRMHKNQRHLFAGEAVCEFGKDKVSFSAKKRGKVEEGWSLMIMLIEDQNSCILGRAK